MSIYDTTQPNVLAPTAAEVAPAVNTPMTTSEANQVLSQYGVNPAEVLSATNITNTVKKTTPDPDDLLGIRKQISDELGLTAQQQAYQNALAAARTRVNDLNKSTALMEGGRVNLGVIRGEQGQARTLAAPEIEALQYQAALEQDKLNALTTERDYRVAIAEKNIDLVRSLKLQYPGAKIGFTDSFNKIEKKLVDYQKEQKKEAEKDAYKDALRSMGLSTKGSRKELEKRLTKANKQAKKQADEVASLQLEQLKLSLENTRSIINQRNDANSSGNIDIASLFGD